MALREQPNVFDVERVRALLDELADRLVAREGEGAIYIVGGSSLAPAHYELGE